MIIINILQVTPDRGAINISVETTTGDTINSATLWTDQTFKNTSQGISLDDKLTGASNKEVFTVGTSELGLNTLDGIYFIEFTSTNNTPTTTCSDCDDLILLGVTADLGYFQECLLNHVLEVQYDTSDVINNMQLTDIYNIKMLLDAVCTSIKFGYYQEAIDVLSSLRKLCATCTSCSQCGNQDTPAFKTGLNFSVLDNNLILQ